MKTKTILIALILGMVAFYGCENGTEPKNEAPVISSLTADSSSVEIGGISTLTCEATDSDGDELTYTWEESSGSISGNGYSVTWTAPDEEGTYSVSCTVDDGNGDQDIESVIITVQEPENVILTIEISNSSYDNLYPAVWFSPSTGEIVAVGDLSDPNAETPPETKYHFWIEPSDPEFAAFDYEDQDIYGVKFIGNGSNYFDVTETSGDGGFISDLLDTGSLEMDNVFYIRTGRRLYNSYIRFTTV